MRFDINRAVVALQRAKERPQFPNPEEALPDSRLQSEVRKVAREMTGDMGRAARVMDSSSRSLAVTYKGVSQQQVDTDVVDRSLLSTKGDNITEVVRCLIDPDFLIDVARYQALFPGLPIGEQAKMLEPLARGQVLVGANDNLLARARAFYNAEGLSIPVSLQKLASVPPVRALFGYASVFARMAIHAADAYKRHNNALKSVSGNNKQLAGLAEQIFEGFAEKEQLRIASMGQITELLILEEQLMQQAMASPDGEDRTAVMDARNEVVKQLAFAMNSHTSSDLETMEKEAGLLQVMGVQLDSESVRAGLLGQVRMDYRLYLTAYRALNIDLNLIQQLLMAATLQVRELQAAFIRQKLTEAGNVYAATKVNMDKTLEAFSQQFVVVDANKRSVNGHMEEIVDPDLVEGHFQEAVV